MCVNPGMCKQVCVTNCVSRCAYRIKLSLLILIDVQEEAWEKFSAGWKYFKGSYYYFSTDKKNWTDSRDACVTMGGHLVILNSQAEMV